MECKRCRSPIVIYCKNKPSIVTRVRIQILGTVISPGLSPIVPACVQDHAEMSLTEFSGAHSWQVLRGSPFLSWKTQPVRDPGLVGQTAGGSALAHQRLPVRVSSGEDQGGEGRKSGVAGEGGMRRREGSSPMGEVRQGGAEESGSGCSSRS